MLRSLRNKGLSVLTALLAPELVLAQAYSEWRQARKLVRSVRHVIIKESMQAAINESDVLIIRAKASLLERDDEQKALKDAETALNKAREALATIESDQSLPDSDLSAIEKANQLLSEMLQRLEIIQDSSPFWRTGFCFPLMLAYLRLHFWFKRNFAQDTRKRPIEFTMADAFFTLMGGYTFSLAGYPRGQNRTLVVEAEGLLHLLRSGALSAYSLSTLRDDVSDRSKADALAKLLVCLQAGWMVINCLCRVSSGLPVTLLELNVLAHVVFAVLMYIFWWRKPHDVRHPISLSPAFLDESLCAMLHTWDPEVALTRSYSGLPEPREGFGWHYFTLEINGQQIRYACSAPVGGGLRDTVFG
ncbi:uncharacterized protein H6S33_007954 [Morchella sextelata]|uniref:uncharacterized protein n=1 Tax=Morchella sextelata TaxID=1174677 RepID=UPI001D042BCC|nr:uncharacterized protein H6S33_007954 [Morchella sextelata]KAH0602950.1 hypothetical protein H6S33_007954 [Morchella sextelata]